MALQLASTYIHALDGRLRIKVNEVKGSLVKALEIEGKLRAIEGINHVKANPTTGNVLILYYPDKIGQYELISVLQHLGCFLEKTKPPIMVGNYGRVSQRLAKTLAETLVRSTVELALQRLVSALI